MPGFKSPQPLGGGNSNAPASQKQLLHNTATTHTAQPIGTHTARKPRVILYNSDEMAKFLHAVSFAEALARNIKLTPGGILSSCGVQQADMKTIRAQAEQTYTQLMNIFSKLCGTGSEKAVQDFLHSRAEVYHSSMRQVTDAYASAGKFNAALQNKLQEWTEIAHIVHGLANATGSVLGVFVPAGKLVTAIGIADAGISAHNEQKSVIGAVTISTGGTVLDKGYELEAKQASKTLNNIMKRDWKYQGALKNAQGRFVTQAGFAGAAKTVSVLLAVKGTVDGVKEASEGLGQLITEPSVTYIPVLRTPKLEEPAIHSK